jgi:hypothetical protein
MAEQGTEEKSSTNGDEGTGRHAASGESTSGEEQASAEQESDSSSAQKSDSANEQKSDSSGQESDSSSEQKTERSEQPSQQQSNGQNRSERSAEDKGSAPRGQADTSWAEPEHEPSGSSRHRSVDVGELAWRTGNVLATVVRTLALLFALVLIVNVVLVLVGVNPANGVAQFVGTVAGVVILGFRDLFVPANPMVMLIVNSAIAAVFWVFVGELLSRVIRYLAARVK